MTQRESSPRPARTFPPLTVFSVAILTPEPDDVEVEAFGAAEAATADVGTASSEHEVGFA